MSRNTNRTLSGVTCCRLVPAAAAAADMVAVLDCRAALAAEVSRTVAEAVRRQAAPPGCLSLCMRWRMDQASL